MLRRITLSVLALALTGMAGNAADMPVKSKIGAIFAEPSGPPPRDERDNPYPMRMLGYTFANGIVARGGYNYGSPYSYFYNGPYYGGPYDGAPDPSTPPRLPYACGVFGYCF
jgi:hypothetical protein